MTTIGEALAAARSLDVSGLDAQVLLAHVLGQTRTWLLGHPEERVSDEQAAAFDELAQQCRDGIPVAYLTERREFYGLVFSVSPAVLVPRPETELLVEAALEWARPRQPLQVADVGTGSGTIAVSLAVNLTGVHVVAADVAWDALAVARRNVARHAIEDKVWLVQTDLLGSLRGPFDLLLANLPYIATEELAALAVARHEPRGALHGGPDGLMVIRRLLKQATQVLRRPGLVLLEIGAQQGQAAQALAHAAWPDASIDVLPDYAGHDRVLRVELSDNP